MNYNPYAAPQAAPPPPGAQSPAGAPQPWEIGEVFGVAWEAFKRNWVVLVFGYLVSMCIAMIPYLAFTLPMIAAGAKAPPGSPAEQSGYLVGLLIPGYTGTLLAMSFFYVGLIRIFVMAARGQQPEFSVLFSGGRRLLPFLGVALLATIASDLGLVFLIVPGVILLCGLCLSYFYVVDAQMGVIGSLKASWAATQGQKGKLFLFGLVAFLLVLASEITCCGVFVATPVVGVAWAVIALRLSGRGGPPAAFVGYGPPGGGYGGPPPGYGPPGGGYGGPPAA